jgi:3-hydroxy-3-methylglutaryl CoA synthase
MTAGILAFGAYIPRLRLQRQAIAAANSWFNPALKGLAKGERAICNWDEDAVTMAVEAARDCLTGIDRKSVRGLQFASTSFPFRDRLNAGIVAEALDIASHVAALDVTASQRAATSALLNALNGGGPTLLIASEKRRAKTASPYEMTNGDGAAAVLVGEGPAIARLVGSASRTADFVDHYRTDDQPFDYQWEERWIRDEGYMKLVPPVIAEALSRAGLQSGDITHFIMPGTLPRIAGTIAKAAGLTESSIRDNLQAGLGETGVAHPLMLFGHTLESAKAGDRILVVGFGQGADAIILEVTPELAKLPARAGVSGHLARRKEEAAYNRCLAINDLVEVERGMRSEVDKQTPLSSLWRNRALLTSFLGGECTKCGTIQIPKSNICVNPNCNAMHTQVPHAFADKSGRINSFTADRLTYSPSLPACYGMVQLEGGGRMMLDFTDVDPERLEVGQPMRMMFRIKDHDTQRGFTRYFWKAAPAPTSAKES